MRHTDINAFRPASDGVVGLRELNERSREIFKRIVESIRDWGRDCYCDPGKDNTCNKRFEWQLGELPFGYDHKYTYSHLGYNLKITDMQAAIGVAQLDRLDEFVAARRSKSAKLTP